MDKQTPFYGKTKNMQKGTPHKKDKHLFRPNHFSFSNRKN